MGTVQGGEADVVFLDMVKQQASMFSDDKKRICVAITRARQAEAIMMCKEMAQPSRYMKPQNLKVIYDGCSSGVHGAVINLRSGDLTKKIKATDRDGCISALIRKMRSSNISGWLFTGFFGLLI